MSRKILQPNKQYSGGFGLSTRVYAPTIKHLRQYAKDTAKIARDTAALTDVRSWLRAYLVKMYATCIFKEERRKHTLSLDVNDSQLLLTVSILAST